MSDLQLLNNLQTSPITDFEDMKGYRDNPIVKSQRPPPVGMESSLQQYDGTNIIQWFARKDVYWKPYGELMVIKK